MSSSGAGSPTRRRGRIDLMSLSRYPILIAYALIAVAPIVLVAMNSFKSRKAIFGDPLGPPDAATFSLKGYETVLAGDFVRQVGNSTVVTVSSVVLVLLVGSMASFAIARYVFRGRRAVNLYLLMGLFLPTTLGSVVTLQMFASLGMVNSLLSLILVYTAQAIPLAVFVLTAFFREVPSEIMDAGRVDGASEVGIYRLVLPLVRPALAAVGVLTMIPVWNDIWWPMILAPSQDSQTLILGTQRFMGQYNTDWNALLSALTMAMAPVLLVFALFSRQLIRGITGGAIK